MAKIYTKDEIRTLVSTDDRWALRALLAIYERQTEDEKTAAKTTHENHVGFSGTDAEFLTSLARQVQMGQALSAKQMAAVKKCMPKYSRQLLEIQNAKVEASQVQAEVVKALDTIASTPVKWYYIGYPDVRKISISKAWTWVTDALSNGQIPGPDSLSLDDLMKQLEDAGLISLDHKKMARYSKKGEIS